MNLTSESAHEHSADPILWVDSHCHLDMLKLGPAVEASDASTASDSVGVSASFLSALEGVLTHARSQGVRHFLCVSVDLARYKRMRQIANAYPYVTHSAGIHPSAQEVRCESQWCDELRGLLQSDEVVAVGETGLDYHYDDVPVAEQRARFAAQIAFSRECDKPLIVHTREARADTIAMLRSEGRGDVQGVMHCFTETWDMAKAALDLGFFISFSGIVTFKNAQDIRDVVKKVPMDRILVETDAPYLAPVPHRGKPNQPGFVPLVGEKVAELKNLSVEEVAQQTTDNYFGLFRGAVPFR